MRDTSRILVVVDPLQNAQQVTVARGAQIAKQMDRGIELLIVHIDREYTDLRVKSPKGWEAARHKIVNKHADHLEGIASILKIQGFDVVISVVCDWPLDESISRHALYTRPFLVVKETHHQSKVNRVLFNHADWNLIANCPSPLWLARSGSLNDGASILACVDPSHPNDKHASLDKKILDATIEFAKKMRLDAHVFHSLLPDCATSMPDTVTNMLSDGILIYEHSNFQKEQFDELLSSYDFAPENIHTAPGYPEHSIPKIEKSLEAGVVVLGAVARNWLGKIVIGSTTEKVLDQLTADLLVVKPEGFKSSVNALSHADAKRDPHGHVFQMPAGSRKDWAPNKAESRS